jgi:formylmethanofuran dehydrogenase subunit E
MTPKNLLKYQEIKFVFDSEPVMKADEPGVICNLCHEFVTEYHSITDLRICNYCWAKS